jgi:CspA family cold shock protein
MDSGNVKWFDRKKGYGFIEGPAGQDVFVHYSSIETEGFRCLRHGEQVEYELKHTERGYQAAHVRPLNAGSRHGSPAGAHD